MIVADLMYDKRGGVLVPRLSTLPKPEPSNHFKLTPKVLHYHIWTRDTETEFEEAKAESMEMLSTVPHLQTLFMKENSELIMTPSGAKPVFSMEMMYFIDPEYKFRKVGLLTKLFGKRV